MDEALAVFDVEDVEVDAFKPERVLVLTVSAGGEDRFSDVLRAREGPGIRVGGYCPRCEFES